MFNFLFQGNLGEMIAPIQSPEQQLLLAIQNRQREKIDDLLENRRVAATCSNDKGVQPMHMACQVGDYALVQRLLELGATLTSSDRSGNTPLHFASKGAAFEMVKWLVAQGASIAQRNSVGHTPYDVGGSHIVRQFLLPLQLQAEAENEPPPDTGGGGGMVGVTYQYSAGVPYGQPPPPQHPGMLGPGHAAHYVPGLFPPPPQQQQLPQAPPPQQQQPVPPPPAAPLPVPGATVKSLSPPPPRPGWAGGPAVSPATGGASTAGPTQPAEPATEREKALGGADESSAVSPAQTPPSAAALFVPPPGMAAATESSGFGAAPASLPNAPTSAPSDASAAAAVTMELVGAQTAAASVVAPLAAAAAITAAAPAPAAPERMPGEGVPVMGHLGLKDVTLREAPVAAGAAAAPLAVQVPIAAPAPPPLPPPPAEGNVSPWAPRSLNNVPISPPHPASAPPSSRQSSSPSGILGGSGGGDGAAGGGGGGYAFPASMTPGRPQHRSASNVDFRPIKADGFHTSASDKRLQALYGHGKNTKIRDNIAPPPKFGAGPAAVGPPSSMPDAPPGAPPGPLVPGMGPVPGAPAAPPSFSYSAYGAGGGGGPAPPRYVSYNAVTNTATVASPPATGSGGGYWGPSSSLPMQYAPLPGQPLPQMGMPQPPQPQQRQQQGYLQPGSFQAPQRTPFTVFDPSTDRVVSADSTSSSVL